MRRQDQEETRKAIVSELRARGQLRQTDLAKKLRFTNSTISYHLKLLKKDGVIAVAESKFYVLAEEGDVETAILSAFKEHGPFEKGDLFKLEKLKVFGAKIRGAYRNLITKGLLVEEDETIKLTRWGTTKLGVCYACYKPVTGLSVADFLTEQMAQQTDQSRGLFTPVSDEFITTVMIHPKCFRKVVNESIADYGGDMFVPEECFCDYCGLPLSIGLYRRLVENTDYVSLDELRKHMLEFENETVGKNKLTFSSDGRRGTEELVAEFEKEAKKTKLNYDSVLRGQELYNAYREIVKEKKERIEGIIHTFYSPIEIAYNSVFAPTMERVATTGLNRDVRPDAEMSFPVKDDYTLVFIGDGGKRLHPYCASLLERQKVKATQTPQGEAVLEQKDSPYGGVGK